MFVSLKNTWLEEHGADGEAWLRKLQNKHGLYKELGTAIYKFVEKKGGMFLNATRTKEDFLEIPKWKLVYCGVSCIKYVVQTRRVSAVCVKIR